MKITGKQAQGKDLGLADRLKREIASGSKIRVVDPLLFDSSTPVRVDDPRN